MLFTASTSATAKVWSGGQKNNGMERLPKRAQEILRELPGGQITLNFVLERATEASDSFRAASAGVQALDASYHRSRAATDFQYFLRGTRSLDRREATNSFSTTSNEENKFTLGVSRSFETGTDLSGEISQSQTKLGFATIAPIDVRESEGSLTLSQSLVKNSFGYGTRRLKSAGDFSRRAAELELQENIELWSIDLISSFYNAWLAQAGAIAARHNLERRERLMNITAIKERRGTAEEPDRLQVQSALLAAKVERDHREKILGDRWRSLVTNLKLPSNWTEIDATLIPLVLDEPSADALAVCGSSLEATQGPSESAATERLNMQARAAELEAQRTNNLLLPDLKIYGTLASNGVDPKQESRAFTEMRTGKHPAYQIGIQLQYSLGQHLERAEASINRANAERLAALASASTDQLKIDWLNACADLRRLVDGAKLRETAYNNQLRRAALEEERFRIGRTTTIGVIQSGDDAALADIDYRTIDIERRIASWHVFHLSNQLGKKLPAKAKQFLTKDL